MKDFYTVLGVTRYATNIEIKKAYRRIALEYHPDRNSGCTTKASIFKEASEAYNTLIDNNLRRSYDNTLGGGNVYRKQHSSFKKSPPPNYRKVYTTRPPPGFKIFDNEQHFKMHYGDGLMEEEIRRATLRMRAAAAAHGYSPLGKSYSSYENPKINVKYGKTQTGGMSFESVVLTPDDNVKSKADGERRGREIVKERMNERRMARKLEQEKKQGDVKGDNNDPKGCFREFAYNGSTASKSNESSCSIM